MKKPSRRMYNSELASLVIALGLTIYGIWNYFLDGPTVWNFTIMCLAILHLTNAWFHANREAKKKARAREKVNLWV